jgi:hypothetical protein
MSKLGDDLLSYEEDKKEISPYPNLAITSGISNVPPRTSVHDMLSEHGFEIHTSGDTFFISMEHVYSRDSTGTVVRVSNSNNIPMNQLFLVLTRQSSTGVVLHRELRLKKDVYKFFTSTWDPHPDFPSTHQDEDENTTTHYTSL